MLKRTTEMSDYSISEKHLQHRERQRRAMCNSGWFFIPTHKRHITKHFIYIFYISSICFLVLFFVLQKYILLAFWMPLFLLLSFFGFFSFLKRLFCVRDLLWVVYTLEQSWQSTWSRASSVVATKSSSHDFFISSFLTIKISTKSQFSFCLSYTFSHPLRHQISQTQHCRWSEHMEDSEDFDMRSLFLRNLSWAYSSLELSHGVAQEWMIIWHTRGVND